MTREEILAVAKPILFNTDIVKAILEDKKTVTRQVIKPQPKDKLVYIMAGYRNGQWKYPDKDIYKYWGDEYKRKANLSRKEELQVWTPPCQCGDILYVRESFRIFRGTTSFQAVDSHIPFNDFVGIQYKADNSHCITNGFDRFLNTAENQRENVVYGRWHPSIHMQKKDARLFLKVTEVRIERLQDITDDDVKREDFDGIIFEDEETGIPAIALSRFIKIWNNTIPKKNRALYDWNANPWVWVIDFHKIIEEKENEPMEAVNE